MMYFFFSCLFDDLIFFFFLFIQKKNTLLNFLLQIYTNKRFKSGLTSITYNNQNKISHGQNNKNVSDIKNKKKT